MVLCAYDHHRARGEKHSSAVTAAVSDVARQMPGMKISETEVKRVLAEYRSNGSEKVVTVTRGTTQREEAESWLDGIKWIAKQVGRLNGCNFPEPEQLSMWAIGVGAKPSYRRTNARE
jgi:hypothetical protein